MNFEAKSELMNDLEKALSDKITAADLRIVLAAVTDQLAGYDLQPLARGAGDPDDLLDVYVSTMRIQGRSEKTLERYRYLITRMMDSLGATTRRITVYHLRKYLADEKARGISDRTLEGTRQVFSAYFGWLQRENLIQQNPVANLGAIKCQKKVKTVYSDVDLEVLKFRCHTIRDRAIITFLAATGCRISEMTQLNRADVDLVNLECKVLGKGNKERTVYLTPVAGMLIRDYLASRSDANPALFAGKGAARLQPGGVRYMLSKLERETGLDHVHPHKFRRTLATRLIRHGMPIQEVASILGHDKLDTTMQYVVLDHTEVKQSYKKFA